MPDEAATDAMRQAIRLGTSEQGARVVLSGPLDVTTVTALCTALEGLDGADPVAVDLSAVTRLDTAGAFALGRFELRRRADGTTVALEGATPGQRDLIATVEAAIPPPPPPPPDARHPVLARIEAVGRAVDAGIRSAAGFVGYLGLFLARLGGVIVRPRRFPLTAMVHHCEEVGVKAVPIVALMAFLIGVVLAFQGAAQLRQFGAEVFVVDLIAVSVLRELGILLTAIIVAGRTASAFTAAIGSMKMREEIDAMRTLGIDPALALMLPRVLALLLMLPILGLVANLMGLLGGALMSWIDLGISPAMFRTRLVEGTAWSHIMIGMVKAPAFALIIGLVGCLGGMRVGGDAESLGRMTSSSVVTAIFAVIVADALFSIFFAQVGL